MGKVFPLDRIRSGSDPGLDGSQAFLISSAESPQQKQSEPALGPAAVMTHYNHDKSPAYPKFKDFCVALCDITWHALMQLQGVLSRIEESEHVLDYCLSLFHHKPRPFSNRSTDRTKTSKTAFTSLRSTVIMCMYKNFDISKV